MIKLSDAIRPAGGSLHIRRVTAPHGRVRLETAQLDASQQQIAEEPSALWRPIRDDHGRRLVRTSSVRSDEVRAARPQGFESPSASDLTTETSKQNVFYFSGHKRTGARSREPKEKVRYS
jgi:hypothetical protein